MGFLILIIVETSGGDFTMYNYQLQRPSLISNMLTYNERMRFMLASTIQSSGKEKNDQVLKGALIFGAGVVAAGAAEASLTYIGFMLMSIGGEDPEEEIKTNYEITPLWGFLISPGALFCHSIHGICVGTPVWLTGKIFNQKGRWWKACVGGMIGSLLREICTWLGCKYNRFKLGYVIGCLFPPLFAVIGYNL